jgi:hypothetical protein
MTNYLLMWAPEGRMIAQVEAKDASAAKRKTPKPYKKYRGEVYVIEDVCTCQNNEDYCNRCLAKGVRR